MPGSNLFSVVSDTLQIALTDETGLAVLARCLGAAPTTANVFQHGCLILRVDSGDGVGAMYQNTGTSAVPSWTLVPLTGGGGGLSTTLTSAHLYVGNASNVATDVAIIGDVTIDNAGVTAISAGVIGDGDINSGAAISFSKLAALTSGNILVGNGSNVPTSVAMSGDVTIDNAGVTTIGAATIDKAMLSSGINPSHMVVAAGSFTTTAGSATQTIANATITGTDLAFVQMYQSGGTPVTIVDVAAIAGGISVLFSADPGNDHVVRYQALRATS